MRWLVFLLVVANCAFAVYARFHETRANDEAQLLKLQMNADKIKLIRAGGAAQAPRAKTGQAPAKAGAAACLEWGGFSSGEFEKAQAALARAQLADKAAAREAAELTGYWVYIPPLKSKPDLDKKVGELKALGVQEFFVMQDNSQWKNAISLGIFRSEEAANGFLARLKERGVRSAVAGSRGGLVKFSVFVIRDVDQETEARLVELKQEFPGSELKAVACPAS